jgi:hypothetical protein
MLQSQLYGVAPTDPVTFASVAVVLLAVALLGVLPACSSLSRHRSIRWAEAALSKVHRLASAALCVFLALRLVEP